MRIQREDIVGARITDVHTVRQVADGGCTCTELYFTVDRGFTFMLPWPGHEWTTSDLPKDAVRMPDHYREELLKAERGWFNRIRFVPASPKIRVLRRIKERTIAGVFCPPMDEELGFYEPDDAFLLLDDGSRVSCRTVAPEGLGTGLLYQTRDEVPESQDLVDIFDVPASP